MSTKKDKEMINCSYCEAAMDKAAVFCDTCGYPENGTEEDYDEYQRKVVYWHAELKKIKGKVWGGQLALYFLAGIVFFICLLWYANEEVPTLLFSSCIGLGVFFLGLGIWSGKAPYIAMLVGLCLYGLFALATVFTIPWLLHLMVIAALVYGLIGADKGKKIMSQLPPHLRKWS